MKKYAIDFSHSTIGFSVKHMMISKIHGTFESYNAEIALPDIEQVEGGSISFTIAVASVSTKKISIEMFTLYLLTFSMPMFILKYYLHPQISKKTWR